MNDINQKQKSEKKFHDEKALGGHAISSFFDLGVSDYLVRKLLEKLDNVRNKRVLELGCGDAWLSKILRDKGGNVHAFDISIESIRQGPIYRNQKKKESITFVCMTAEQLAFKSNTFDIVIGNAILHHTDLHRTLEEIFRVLKDGGKAYFAEPLGHNPFINYYRSRTPELRSPDEKPLLFNDIAEFKNKFNTVRHEEYYFLALLAFFFYFVIKNNRLFIKSLNVLLKIDEIVLKMFPVFKRYCWSAVILLEK